MLGRFHRRGLVQFRVGFEVGHHLELDLLRIEKSKYEVRDWSLRTKYVIGH